MNLFERNKLIEKHVSLVYEIVKRKRRFFPIHVSNDELISYGMFGLIDAAIKYKKKRNVQFGAYARIRIIGSINDGLRNSDYISRDKRKKINDIIKLENEIGASLSEDEIENKISEKLKCSVKKIHALKEELFRNNPMSLSVIEEIDKRNLRNLWQDNRNFLHKLILQDYLNYLMNRTALDIRERTIIMMHFLEGVYLHEIAKVFNLTEGMVSILKKRAIRKLREQAVNSEKKFK